MSVFKRLKRVLKSNANAALDKVEDPMKLARQQLIDYDEAYRALRERTVEAIAEKDLTAKTVKQTEDEIKTYAIRASKAVEAGNDADAKHYLLAKKNSEAKLETLSKILDEKTALADKLQSELEKLAYRIEEAKMAFSSLKSKQALVDARKKTNEVLADLPLADGNSLDNAKSYIDLEIAKLDVDEKLLDEEKPGGDIASLNEKYDRADLEEQIENELKELKKSKEKDKE